MANGKSPGLGAPTYDRIGIDSATAGPSLPQYQERVVAALRLGWELEELVARSYLLGEPSVPPKQPIPGTPHVLQAQTTSPPANLNELPPSLFLPDLFHSQSEQARLQSVVTIVRAQPVLMFPGPTTTQQPPDGQTAMPATDLVTKLTTAVTTLH